MAFHTSTCYMLSLLCFICITISVLTGARKPCPALKAPHNGRFEEIPGRPGRFRFYCREGYLINGPSKRSCQHNGKWTGIQPLCFSQDLYRCPALRTPRNGFKHGDGQVLGATVTFYCAKGYTLIGPDQRMCLGGYNWSGYQPECENRKSPMDIAKALHSRVISPLAMSTDNSDDGKATGRLAVGPNGLEIIVLLDRSSSIHHKQFKQGKTFVKMILTRFGISPAPDGGGNGSRVALISFGDKARLHFNLDDPDVRSLSSITTVLSTVKPAGGGTNLRAAFDLVYTKVSDPKIRRERATRAIFLITDGKSNVGNPATIARDLRETRHFEIFAIGVGNKIDRHQLKLFASHPYAEHVFIIEDFASLENIGDIISEKNIDYSKCGVSGNIETDDQMGKALKGAWPWHGWVNIFLPIPRTCGGALICKNWFITSAHCLTKDGEVVDPQKVELYLGDHVLTKVDKSEHASKIKNIHIHPNYNDTTYENSVALIEIGEENGPEMNKFVRPLCVISNSSSYDYLYASAITQFGKGWIIGWGHSPLGYNIWPKLHQVERHVIPRKDCQKAYPESDMDRFICVGDKYIDEMYCRGDVGGPFVAMLKSDQFVVLGIALNTSLCVEHNNYGLYLNVLHEDIVSWVANTTSSCSMTTHNDNSL